MVSERQVAVETKTPLILCVFVVNSPSSNDLPMLEEQVPDVVGLLCSRLPSLKMPPHIFVVQYGSGLKQKHGTS